jgi:hypothetical protein
MVFGNKNPVWVDLDRGICGTFSRFEEQGTEKDYVYPYFYPFNSWKEVRYTFPVSRLAVHVVYPDKQAKGVETQIIFCFQGGDESLVTKFIDQKNVRLIKELQERIKDLEVEKSTHMQRAEDAFAGAEKTVLKQKNLGKKEENNPLSPFGIDRKIFDDV